MMQSRLLKCILVVLILCNFFVGISFSLSYERSYPEKWNAVSQPDMVYNKSGWTTYSIEAGPVYLLKILDDGTFSFAWKMDPSDSSNKLYYKNSPFNYATEWKELNSINVRGSEVLSWSCTGNAWIAFPNETTTNITTTNITTTNITPTNITTTNITPTNITPTNMTIILKGPTKPEFNISSGGFLWLSNILYISVNATDPNNDSINYSWNWDDNTPNSSSILIPSGEDAVQSHSYNISGTYLIKVTASNSNGKGSSSAINLTVVPTKPPEMPIGNCSGYIDTNYLYSTVLNINSSIKNFGFIFDWGDGSQSEVTIDEVEHKWTQSGTKKVKALALDMQKNPGDWSEEFMVDIYIPKYLNDEDLQMVINNALDFTEIIMNNKTYNINKEISINKKDHLSLKSSMPPTLITNSQDVRAIISISDSKFINISGLLIKESANLIGGPICLLAMMDSNNCRIKNCIINVNGQNDAIFLGNKGYNQLEDINIKHEDQNMRFGIILDKSSFNLIKNITFDSSIKSDNFSHIVLKSPHQSNHIIKSNETQNLTILYDDCIYTWKNNTDSLVPKDDQCQAEIDIDINDNELTFK